VIREQAHDRRCASGAQSIQQQRAQSLGLHADGRGGNGDGDGGGGEKGGRDGGKREKSRQNTPQKAVNSEGIAIDGLQGRPARRRHMESMKQRTIEGIQVIQELKFEELQPQTWRLLQVLLRNTQDYIQESEEERHAIEEDKRGLQVKVEAPQYARNTDSWAQVLGGTPPNPGPARGTVGPDSSSYPPTMIDNAKAKQMTLRFDNEEIRKAFTGSTSTQLVHTFRNNACPAAASIVAARRTIRGDIILNTTTIEARQELEEATEWAKSVDPSARILRQTCLIGVYGVRKDTVDDTN